jgi:GH35 family endo-1,4-beta-xylanase
MMKESLGGAGKTGYDWLIKAFELAYERWPDAILIYNDYNTFQWNTDEYIDLVRTLRDAGAPIDAYGCQSHDLTDCSLSKFQQSEKKIQDALKMPMYSTEYDIGTTDDALQLQRYKEQIPYMGRKTTAQALLCGAISMVLRGLPTVTLVSSRMARTVLL